MDHARPAAATMGSQNLVKPPSSDQDPERLSPEVASGLAVVQLSFQSRLVDPADFAVLPQRRFDFAPDLAADLTDGVGTPAGCRCSTAVTGAAAPGPVNCACAFTANKPLSRTTNCLRCIVERLPSTPDAGRLQRSATPDLGHPRRLEELRCKVQLRPNAILERSGFCAARMAQKLDRHFYRAITAIGAFLGPGLAPTLHRWLPNRCTHTISNRTLRSDGSGALPNGVQFWLQRVRGRSCSMRNTGWASPICVWSSGRAAPAGAAFDAYSARACTARPAGAAPRPVRGLGGGSRRRRPPPAAEAAREPAKR